MISSYFSFDTDQIYPHHGNNAISYTTSYLPQYLDKHASDIHCAYLSEYFEVRI